MNLLQNNVENVTFAEQVFLQYDRQLNMSKVVQQPALKL